MSDYFDSVASSWDENPMKIERARVTAAKVKEIDFGSYNSVVDFGSGTGLLGIQLRNTFTHVHLADSSAKMLEEAKSKIAKASLNNVHTHQVKCVSELNSRYSAIVTLMTLHHIPDVQGFFSQAHSVLEQGGTLIIADLYKENGSFHRHNPEFSGHNGFDVSELKVIAEHSGFYVELVEPYFEIFQENEAGVEVSYPLFFWLPKNRYK
ncbi:class I SAM-dependent methyltransferase [Vibrio parahaemolyticus]|uniref:class I SAM-dependent DNA methyltransferase n=1 Tax=Vibrio parahaemolyticus TaxID=670 RepID=UPI0006B263F3|nr:class I SAM-dependent methyltransferase [Vibrio parahaemolyticus]KOY36154.1 hypothetical protein ACX08_06605 [Vibrio parahaemolyticus]MCR9873772.1 class I SAM-dependent methyltransferase [Vibrio parahaemolyticus]